MPPPIAGAAQRLPRRQQPVAARPGAAGLARSPCRAATTSSDRLRQAAAAMAFEVSSVPERHGGANISRWVANAGRGYSLGGGDDLPSSTRSSAGRRSTARSSGSGAPRRLPCAFLMWAHSSTLRRLSGSPQAVARSQSCLTSSASCVKHDVVGHQGRRGTTRRARPGAPERSCPTGRSSGARPAPSPAARSALRCDRRLWLFM